MYDSLYTQITFGRMIIMRKLILEIEPNEMIREVQKPIFENIHSYEVLEMLKIDWDEATGSLARTYAC